MHTLAAQVNGHVNGANAGRLFIKYSNGTIVNVWQNTGAYDDPQSVNGSFTTPTGVNSFQVGTAVTLDKGYLEFSKVTLTAYSAALPITAGDTYQFTGQVAGALAAPLGQGGRIVAAYTNVDGQSAGEDLLWQNPTNFNGTVPVQQTFTANANAATLRLALTAVLDAGHLDFGDFALQRLAAGDVIRRSTYMLAGQAVAVRVSGDPDGNDGLHYLYSDHLGSASAIQNSDGSAPIITRYTPFGSYRAGSGTNEVTDRGFTGQPENMDLGLYYYQARFYVPAIGRFASADTIVPDPANPQQYNRYTYTLNNPLRYSDPTGHCTQYIMEGTSDQYESCTDAWAAIREYWVMLGIERGVEMPIAWLGDLFENATIETLELIMKGIGIDYDYKYSKPINDQIYGQPNCQYWQPCWESEYQTTHTESKFLVQRQTYIDG